MWRGDGTGTHHARLRIVRARNLHEIAVYIKAQRAGAAVSAVLNRPSFRKDFDLADQLSRSSRRIAPLIAEGFGQLTDRHFATYLGRARGSVQGNDRSLAGCLEKQYFSKSECARHIDRYDQIGRMLTRWIGYLRRTDWKDRR
jgi:four helix bundle protein